MRCSAHYKSTNSAEQTFPLRVPRIKINTHNLKIIAKKAINEGFWTSQSKQPTWKIWAGLSFESVCYKHIDQIRKALHIDPGATVGTWRFMQKAAAEEGTQIDLLFDRLDDSITLCEIKSCDKPFAIDKAYAQTLLKKMEVFASRHVQKSSFFSL